MRTGLLAPDSTSYDPVLILLNTEDKEERDKLTRQWRDNKLSELNFVGIVVAVTFTIVTVIAASVFFAGQVSLFSACEEAGQEGSDE
ncbi:hypothetical protein W97_03325 [Coniosporium apollinis CBS 100218]|uniref:Uncharacterized protein n=1 Tax=Coniosporium apollinis (strain CBS 100218) TaxID=1168221 RepID=R7YQC3_CONA1|nr:uncharacterized protein W97_03325 [Coniosporium apollinis CBS 100218]EON64095.1 hypothetical protein W97_03325 [Coniosporium apollinis CBS 100218]